MVARALRLRLPPAPSSSLRSRVKAPAAPPTCVEELGAASPVVLVLWRAFAGVFWSMAPSLFKSSGKGGGIESEDVRREPDQPRQVHFSNVPV